jgi:hypothetical protein
VELNFHTYILSCPARGQPHYGQVFQLVLTKRCVINNLLTHDKESYEIPKDLNSYNDFRMEHRPHDITRMGIKILKDTTVTLRCTKKE